MKVNVFNIYIDIDEFSMEAAIEKLQRVAKDIKEGVRDCSEHPCGEEPYLPDIIYSCGERYVDVSDRWFGGYSDEEIEKMEILTDKWKKIKLTKK